MLAAPKLPRGVLLALTALDLLLLVFGVYKVSDEIVFASQAETAIGTIQDFSGNRARVRYRIEKELHGGPRGEDDGPLLVPRLQINMYQPEVEAARLPILEKGDEVEVLFRPDRPQEARLGGFWQRYSSPIIALVAAGALALFVVPAWRRRNVSPLPPPKAPRKKRRK